MEKEEQKKVLESEIESLNEEIRNLGSRLEGILNVGCSLGVCAYNPEVDDVQEKLQEVQKKRAVLEKIRGNLDSCQID